MSGSESGRVFEIAVEPCNENYDPDDEGWRDQVATLYQDLDDEFDTVRRGHRWRGLKVRSTS